MPANIARRSVVPSGMGWSHSNPHLQRTPRTLPDCTSRATEPRLFTVRAVQMGARWTIHGKQSSREGGGHVYGTEWALCRLAAAQS